MVHKTKSSPPAEDFNAEGMIKFYGNIASSVAGKLKTSRDGSGSNTEAEVSVSMDGGHDA